MAENIETKTQARQLKLNELLDTSQKKTYFVAAVTVLFVIVMLLVGVLPSYSAFTAQAANNALRQEAIDQLETKRTTIENLVKEEGAKEGILNEFDTAFPTAKPDQVDVVTSVDRLATENGVTLLSTTITDIINTNDIIKKFLVTTQVKAQAIGAVLEGDRDSLANFVEDVEKNVGIYDITSVIIARKLGKELEQSPPGREFRLTISFNYFYYVQNPTL